MERTWALGEIENVEVIGISEWWDRDSENDDLEGWWRGWVVEDQIESEKGGEFFGWCRVYGRELLVQIDDNDVRRVWEMVVDLREVG